MGHVERGLADRALNLFKSDSKGVFLSENSSMIYSGTSGLVLPVANKLLFPEEYRHKSRLQYYASLFNSIEINSSFKKVPMPRTVVKWTESVPDNFRFTFKLPKSVTHNKELAFNPEDVRHFMEAVSPAAEKKGCLLVQFPGKLNAGNTAELVNLLNLLRGYNPRREWKVAVEFRNNSWYHQDIYSMLVEYNMSMVFHDLPAAPTLDHAPFEFIYVRFHGTEKNYRGSYSMDILTSYAERIRVWKTEGKDVFVYFNNTLGEAVNNLIALNQLVF